MATKQTQHDKEFKINAVKYIEEHPNLTQEQCAKNLGIGLSTLSRWRQQYRTNDGDVPVRGSGNYESDDKKEIARLKIFNQTRTLILYYPKYLPASLSHL